MQTLNWSIQTFNSNIQTFNSNIQLNIFTNISIQLFKHSIPTSKHSIQTFNSNIQFKLIKNSIKMFKSKHQTFKQSIKTFNLNAPFKQYFLLQGWLPFPIFHCRGVPWYNKVNSFLYIFIQCISSLWTFRPSCSEFIYPNWAMGAVWILTLGRFL